jgi:ATP/maltotriose-dependent transcriptional regulator MalT
MADTIVGREGELAAIERLLASEEPGLAAIVLEGEPGIGKTTLWQAAFDFAARQSVEALSCRPVEAEAKLALASLSDLLSPLVDAGLAELPEPQRVTLEVTLLRSAPHGSPPDARAVATATHSLLRARSARGPFLIAIDDVQWLDRSSAAALSFALRRLADVPVRVLLCVRVDQSSSPSPDPLDLRRNVPGVECLRLGPVSLGGLHHLLKDQLGQVLPRPMLQRVAEASEGNPLLALELARALLELGARPGPGEPLPVPETLAALLNARLRRLPAAAREALLAAAALSHPEASLISEALGRTSHAGLDSAEQAGIIHVRDGLVRFDHPLFASTLYSNASPAKRRGLHRLLADVVGEPEEQARHLALAAAGPDADVAHLLDDAADQARLRGAPSAAAELMELSLQLTADVDEVPRRTVKLAGFLNAAGDVARSEAVLQQAIPGLPRGLARAEAILLYGVIVSEPTDHAKSIEWCLEALEEAAADPVLEARIHIYLAQSFGDLDEQRSVVHARKAVELLGPVDHGLTYANALQALAQAELLAGLPPNEQAIDEAMAIEEREARGRFGADLMFVPAFWASHCDDFQTAYTRFQAYLDLAEDVGDEAVRPYLLGHLAETECQHGRWDSAVRHAEESVAYAEQVGQRGHARFMAMYSSACVAAFRGKLEEADAIAEQLDDAFAQPNERGRVFLLSLRGFVELSRGDLAAADRHYASADAILAAIGIREPARFRFHGDHVEAVIGLGDLERAEAMVERLAERAKVFPRPWTLAIGARARGLLRVAHGDLEEGEAAFRDALVENRRLSMPFELARTHLVLGQLLRRRGRRRAAVEELERARTIFAELGAPLWAARTESELRRIPMRRKARDDTLTPTEERVAELAAAGRTNREVAQALFISPKTVEANLSRVYRKLEIRSRAELGARMAERGQGEAAAKQ